jgi:hypothetical protein
MQKITLAWLAFAGFKLYQLKACNKIKAATK